MKRAVNLSLHLITKRETLELEAFFSIIQAAIKGGVTVVQLREKEASDRDMITIGKKLLLLLKPLRVPLIINDRVDVAHAIGADGVHLGQSDLSVKDARAILGENAIVGLSVESLEQAISAGGEDLDYLAAGPLFPTMTKLDCGLRWSLSDLRQLCAVSNHPVIAIGGIDETHVKQIMGCGAAGIAVASAIFNASCPKAAAITLTTRRSDE